MSIETELNTLEQNISDLQDAIVAKGGTITGDGLADLVADVESLPSGGGGGPTTYGRIWYCEPEDTKQAVIILDSSQSVSVVQIRIFTAAEKLAEYNLTSCTLECSDPSSSSPNWSLMELDGWEPITTISDANLKSQWGIVASGVAEGGFMDMVRLNLHVVTIWDPTKLKVAELGNRSEEHTSELQSRI